MFSYFDEQKICLYSMLLWIIVVSVKLKLYLTMYIQVYEFLTD